MYLNVFSYLLTNNVLLKYFVYDKLHVFIKIFK